MMTAVALLDAGAKRVKSRAKAGIPCPLSVAAIAMIAKIASTAKIKPTTENATVCALAVRRGI